MAERNFLDDIADLKRKIADLERATRNPQFSDGDDLDEGGYGGALILNNLENDIDPSDPAIVAQLIAQHGWELPAMPSGWSKANDFQTVTSGAFVGCYTQQYHQAIADGFQTLVLWATDGATTGELRVHNDVVPAGNTNVITLGAGTNGAQLFTWLHGQTIGTGPFRPQIQARRTGGAGNVYIFQPDYGYQVGGRWISATSGGT